MHPRLVAAVTLGWLATLGLGCTPGSVGADSDAGPTAADAGPRVVCAEGDGALGAACGCEDACESAAPRCARDRLLDPGGVDYCTFDCAGDGDCPRGYDCASGPGSEGRPFCRRCLNEEAGLVPVAEACLCAADCAPGPRGEATECAGGVCRVTACTPGDMGSCPEGWACELDVSRRGRCAECVGEPSPEGGACGCSADCDGGLVCHRGQCARPCEIDEQCGRDACTYRTDAPPACEAPVLDCAADHSVGPGGSCACNADCGGDAPACLLGEIGDVPIDRCTIRCTPGAGECPGGTACCGADGVLPPTCLPSDVVGALGGVLSCA